MASVQDTRIHSARRPYAIIFSGLLLFVARLGIDLYQHGSDFIIHELYEAPVVHGLPIAGMVVILVGVIMGWRRVEPGRKFPPG